jgi:homogentisate 1,2-dioxygenase
LPFTPQNAKKRVGQHLEHSPFSAILLPSELETHDEKVTFTKSKKRRYDEVVYATHPFDVIGWDGYNSIRI